MSLTDELRVEVAATFRASWSERDGDKVPESTDLKLGNDAVKLIGAVLYADMKESTDLVDTHKPFFAAEIYKTFLHCAARIVRAEGGAITAYDGDRIMGVFIGLGAADGAARSALKINYARLEVINPAIKAQYPDSTYALKHVVGVDKGPLFVARTGIRGANDLVWVGRVANHAAKLASLAPEYSSVITAEVYNDLSVNAITGSDGKNMWNYATWNGRIVYRSTYMWSP